MNILLSCIGKRGYLADFFRNELDSRSKIIGTSNTHWTPGFSACDYAAVLPPISSDDYIPALLDVCQKYDVRALLSFFDPDVHKLSLYRNWFFEAGVLPVIPSHTAADLSFDKLKTWNYMNDIGVPSPHTSASLQDSKELLEKGIFHFPLIIKPRFGFGSHNTFIARNIKEMEVFFDYAPHMIIQNYIEGEALNVDGLGDMNSN
ncbi:MAG: ATP-grasp domain-containing protein, partial [Verrucomicrobia bacterium]|nr:ATP-grasp domain-containing protein [Verrucomicrobiota bacterium]